MASPQDIAVAFTDAFAGRYAGAAPALCARSPLLPRVSSLFLRSC